MLAGVGLGEASQDGVVLAVPGQVGAVVVGELLSADPAERVAGRSAAGGGGVAVGLVVVLGGEASAAVDEGECGALVVGDGVEVLPVVGGLADEAAGGVAGVLRPCAVGGDGRDADGGVLGRCSVTTPPAFLEMTARWAWSTES